MTRPVEGARPYAFKSHALRESPERLVLVPALRLRFFALVLFVPGLVILVLSLLLALEHTNALAFAVVGAVFVVAGLWFPAPRVVIDLRRQHVETGSFWARRRTPLTTVRAVQIADGGRHISESATDLTLSTVQLNVVLDGSRLPLLNHPDREAIHAVGRRLADVLRVPLHGG